MKKQQTTSNNIKLLEQNTTTYSGYFTVITKQGDYNNSSQLVEYEGIKSLYELANLIIEKTNYNDFSNKVMSLRANKIFYHAHYDDEIKSLNNLISKILNKLTY